MDTLKKLQIDESPLKCVSHRIIGDHDQNMTQHVLISMHVFGNNLLKKTIAVSQVCPASAHT